MLKYTLTRGAAVAVRHALKSTLTRVAARAARAHAFMLSPSSGAAADPALCEPDGLACARPSVGFSTLSMSGSLRAAPSAGLALPMPGSASDRGPPARSSGAANGGSAP